MKQLSRREAVKKYRTINATLSYADAWAWSVLDDALRRRIEAAISVDRAHDIQFGNITGRLRDVGRPDLVCDLHDAIDEFNAEQKERRRRAVEGYERA